VIFDPDEGILGTFQEVQGIRASDCTLQGTIVITLRKSMVIKGKRETRFRLTQAFITLLPQLSIIWGLVSDPGIVAFSLRSVERAKSCAKEEDIVLEEWVRCGSMKKRLYMRPHHVVIPTRHSPFGLIDNSTERPISKLGVTMIGPINKIISRQNHNIIWFKSHV